MNLLTDEEMTELVTANLEAGGGYHQLGHSVQAAILAKLASAELPTLPEPSEMDGARWGYTSDDMRNYAIDAYAQGAAAQLSAEPVAHLRKNGFRFLGDFEPQDDSELPLYTRRQAND